MKSNLTFFISIVFLSALFLIYLDGEMGGYSPLDWVLDYLIEFWDLLLFLLILIYITKLIVKNKKT